MHDDAPKPRVVLITREFPVLSETFIVQRFHELLARGWDIHVVCDETPSDGWSFFPHLPAALRSRVHVRRPTEPAVLGALFAPFVLARLLLRAPMRTVRYVVRGWRLLGPRALKRLYSDEQLILLDPGVVHFVFGTFAIGSEYLGAVLGCALVVSFQGGDLNYAGLDREPGFYSEVWRSADAIHFLGEDLRSRALKRGYEPDARGHVVVPGIDVAAFAPRQRVRERDEPLRILSVGRMHWKKGYEYALQAVRVLVDQGVDLRYRIVGGGTHRDAVLYARSDLGLDGMVELLGARSPEEVREQMQWADVLLHAASSEGFCYAVVEAQAMELPVVTSDADGLGENVSDGETGFVVPRRDAQALADAMFKLSGDAELRARMGAAGRKRVLESFRTEREVDGFEALYRDATRVTGARPDDPPN